MVRGVASRRKAGDCVEFTLPSRSIDRRSHWQSQGFSASFSNLTIDERLREKEFGILDRLTRLGIEQRHPELAASRQLVGKFYYRPPAGESWCDVILRLRSVLDTISLHHGGKHVLIVAH
jgi:probable phosphoglycerate mutase